MAFEYCGLNDDEIRSYHPGSPWQEWLHGEFIPSAGTIDRENDIRLFKFGNGPVDEPSDLFQFILDYKGFPIRVELAQVLKGYDVYWRLCNIDGYGFNIHHGKDFPYNPQDVIQSLRDAMKVYGFDGHNFKDEAIIHIQF